MSVLARVRRFIREHDLVAPGARVVAAVSGGGDSMALLHLLAALDRGGALRLAGVAHFNHQLRETAHRDEAFVHAAARALGLRLVCAREDVAARAAREKRSVESAARDARHAFFERARVELKADVVALGHTKDDQAETFLLRLLRGAGPRGLAAMHPRNGAIVRPLLDCRHGELVSWLAEAGVRHVDDETNADVAIPRNRIRAELMPLLAERFNPSIVDILADEAAIAREISAWMDEASAPFLTTPGELDITVLASQPDALQRLVVRRALTAASGGRHISFDHVSSVVRLMQSGDGSLDLPGQTVQRIGGRIVINNSKGSLGSRGSGGSLGSGSQGSRGRHSNPANPTHPEHPANRANPANQFAYSLSIPGSVVVRETGCLVTAEADGETGQGFERSATLGTGPVAVVRRDLLSKSLVVRNRRPGDRFRPVGLHGWKKLQDLFVDRKLARAKRDAVPLVVDETDRIVWVAGYGIDEAFQVTDTAQSVLLLRLTTTREGVVPVQAGEALS